MALDFNAFAAGQAASGDAVGDIMRQRVAALQTQGLQLQNQAAQTQLDQQKIALQRQQTFGTDMQGFLANPTATGVASLFGKYPEFSKQISDSWNTLDTAQRRTDATQLGSVATLIAKGDYDNAAQLVQTRVDADKAAGRDSSQDEQALAMLKSGDPKQQKAVLGLATIEAAGAVGPDKAAEWLKSMGLSGEPVSLGMEDRLVTAQGDTLVGATPKLQHVEVNNVDGSQTSTTFNPFTGGFGGAAVSGAPAEGGGPASGGGGGGMQSAIATVLHNEGGYNPKDMNGAPVNFGINAKANAAELNKLGISDIKNMTQEQAAQIYASKYWPQSGAESLPANLQTPYFDVYIRNPAMAKKALAESGGDPQKFMQIASGYFQRLGQTANGQKYAKAWANRDANNMALASGSAPASQGGAPGVSPAPVSGSPYVFGGSSGGVNTRNAPAGYGWNQQHTALVPISGGPADPNSGGAVLQKYGIAPNETGSSVLTKLPANISSQVKALAEGRLPMPSSFALAKPYWQTMLQLTSQYDPTFDAANAPARKAAITAFTGMGRGAQVVGSVNRVANHLQLLWDESNKLAGPDLGFGPLNSAVATAGQAFQPADAKAYDTEVQFVGGELEKIARNSPGSVSGVEKIVANLSRRNSAETRAAAIKAAVGIISGAVDPLKDQYNSAFTNESARPNIPWVTPKAQGIYKNIGGVDLSLTGAGAESNGHAASRQPPTGATRTATGPNGQKAALVNGHWVTY